MLVVFPNLFVVPAKLLSLKWPVHNGSEARPVHQALAMKRRGGGLRGHVHRITHTIPHTWGPKPHFPVGHFASMRATVLLQIPQAGIFLFPSSTSASSAAVIVINMSLENSSCVPEPELT